MNPRLAPRARGVSLIEALIALVVLAFGMLALAGMQTAMWRNGDLARQRSEALQLAQHRVEALRSFASIDANGSLIAWNDLPDSQTEEGLHASADTATGAHGNTLFTRNTELGGHRRDMRRSVQVIVSWADRAGDTQSLDLASAIARSDPADAGTLSLPPITGGILRWPKGRDIGIPMQAIKLGGDNAGKSTSRWPGASGGWLVFSDRDGKLLAHCDSQPDDHTAIATACTPMDAYLLTGFIGSDAASHAATGIAFSAMQYAVGPPECYVADAIDPNGLGAIAGYQSYVCLIQPSDHDGDPASAPVWSGRTDITPAPVGHQKVCRYTPGANASDNRDHPQVYRLVDLTLDHQNFFLAAHGDCPAGTQQHAP